MAVYGPEVLFYEKPAGTHVAIMTINREERGNSSSFDLNDRFRECWADAKHDENVWVVIVTGKGDRFFNSGEDLRERAELDQVPGTWEARYRQSQLLGPASPTDFWKPTIAAINGFALAGGWALAMRQDVRIAAEHARFGVPEVRWNLPAPFMAQCARTMIPMGIALELTMWGARQYTAQRMYEVGFVNKVVPKERLMEEAMAWAEEVCEMGPVSVRTHKEHIYRTCFPDNDNINRHGMALFDKCQAMEDSIEGPRAFAEKRKPVWKLR